MADLIDLASGEFLLKSWERLKNVPGGRAIFSRIVGGFAPYSGTIRPLIEDLAPGNCRVRLREHRRIRNHLNSVHAMALANLAELASGLALVCCVPSGSRAILVGFRIEYKKKGRGDLYAEASFDPLPVREHGEHEVAVSVRNASEELVAEATARWLVGGVRS